MHEILQCIGRKKIYPLEYVQFDGVYFAFARLQHIGAGADDEIAVEKDCENVKFSVGF
jgi:hypothetical protein